MKTILSLAIAMTLLTSVIALTPIALAKTSICTSNHCEIIAKKGDIEIDKLIINVPTVAGPPGTNGTNGVNGTTLDNQTLTDINTLVTQFRAGNLTGGITSLEVVNATNSTG